MPPIKNTSKLCNSLLPIHAELFSELGELGKPIHISEFSNPLLPGCQELLSDLIELCDALLPLGPGTSQ